MGREDAPSFQRSDIVRWKLHLIELGNSPKTINDGKLAALKAIFRWGVDNELLDANPASGVSIRRGKKAGERMLGFEKNEAATILAAAARAAKPLYRWVPLLCAQSGARVAEVCQLRGEDIRTEDGIPFMHFTMAAGALKNPTFERKVPLHPLVIGAGFLEFVRRKGSGPLFYDPKRRRPGAKKPQPKIAAKNVARWVHTRGIDVGRRFRKDPNHAWRPPINFLSTRSPQHTSTPAKHVSPFWRRFGSPLPIANAAKTVNGPPHKGDPRPCAKSSYPAAFSQP